MDDGRESGYHVVSADSKQVVDIGEFDKMFSTVKDLAAEALFVSYLQPSESPTRASVEQAITMMILRHGSDGCAAGVATEFGDHPEAAVRRMAWVHAALAEVLAPPRMPVLH
ncbi:hypothetical protein [Actinoplanes campanulatus]|uniref:hypothetical protein n=1 Tax=Actinoplanes campanulatus TaxID=113559 RepID=UPI001EF23BE2|nr:hypothetical protein [Actinoplanes capillaceus]